MTTVNEIFAPAPSLLLEAPNYVVMFNDVRRILGDTPEGKTAERVIRSAVEQARRCLRKQDRIVWYLRLWKMGFVWSLSQRPADTARDDAEPGGFDLLLRKMAQDYVRKRGSTVDNAIDEGYYVYHDQHLLDDLEHYLSLPIAAIRNRVFAYDDPDKVRTEFADLEKQWQDEAKGAFADPQVKPLITFPDGFAWFDLDTAYCSKEADAMGHCGNRPRQHSDDNILSLRKLVQRGDQVLHKPYLTFILDGNGLLGEMKGRFNKKPAPAFHPHIIALLRHPVVRGIKGGGYLPENNFSLDDLDADTRAALVEAKPELGGLRAMYRKYGLGDRVETMLSETLARRGIEPEHLHRRGDATYMIADWRDLSRFLSDVDDAVVAEMVEIVESKGEDVALDEIVTLDEEDLFDAIDALPDREHAKLLRLLSVEPVPHNQTIPHRRAVGLAVERLLRSDLHDELLAIINERAEMPESALVRLRERIAAYLEVGYPFRGSWQYVEIDRDDYDAAVEMLIDAERLIDIADAEEDEEEDYYLHDVKQHGWTTVDWDYLNEQRREAGLTVKQRGADPVLRQVLNMAAFDLPAAVRDLVDRLGL